MYTVKLLTEAEIEVSEACKWYEEKQPGLAAKFLKELDYYLDLVAKNPLHFPVKFSDRYSLVKGAREQAPFLFF